MRWAMANRANGITATLLAAALGVGLFASHFGDGLQRLSYDLPFIWRAKMAAPEVVLIYLDERSALELRQPMDAVWDRTVHTQLLDRLTRDGARAILYDIVFEAPSANPQTDADFAAAIRRHGRVVLSAGVEVGRQMGVGSQSVIPPTLPLREAAADWGLASFEMDADYGVRRIFPGADGVRSATSAMSTRLDGDGGWTAERWLNYYGPSDWLSGVSVAQALRDDGVPPGFFRNKVVVVGLRPVIGQARLAKDEFAGPWSRWGGRFFSGPEIYATALLNLVHRDWLERLSAPVEIACLALTALFAGLVLPRLTPVRAALAGVAGSVTVAAGEAAGVWFARVWWAWLIAAAVQIPFGVIWSVGTHYFIEARRRAVLRRAFSLYLSPHMADRIAASEFDLRPGGQLVEATCMFTDLEGSAALSEELGDPAALSAILIRYFSRTTACILETDGTILKYHGDAVQAVWNAPLADPHHALKAVRAACQLRDAARFEANGRIFRTRVGIHTGPGFAGNLGSGFVSITR